MRLGIAIKAFFTVLFDKETAEQIGRVLADEALPAPELPAAPEKKPPAPKPPPRSPAITLLATLQREARLVDLIHEDLAQYSDAQVGAAARPCLQQCAGVLDRLLQIQPVVQAADGEMIDVDAGASAFRYQWVGEGSAEQGKLIHHGWQATQVELPQWTGDASDAGIIAPAQVSAS